MSDTTEGQKRGVLVAISAGAVVIVAVIAVLIGMSSGSDDTTATTGASASDGDSADPTSSDDTASSDGAGEPDQTLTQGGGFLSESMGGQEAIDTLGEDIEAVAAKNQMSVEELKDLLLRDSAARISPGGFILYVDPAPEG